MSRIALNLQKLASRKETERREVQEDLRALTVLRTPVARMYNLGHGVSQVAPSTKRPPPLPKKKAEREVLPSMASLPRQFPSTRVGLTTASPASRSGVLFLVAIALAVVTMSAIALAVVVPSAEWAFVPG